MTLYLYKIGTDRPVLMIEDVVSYTDKEVRTKDGGIYSPLAEDHELSSRPDCSEALRAGWQQMRQGQDIPLCLSPEATAILGQANHFRRSSEGLVVLNVAVSTEGPGGGAIRAAMLPEGYRPRAAVGSGDVTVHPDGTVWAGGSGAGSVCFYSAQPVVKSSSR